MSEVAHSRRCPPRQSKDTGLLHTARGTQLHSSGRKGRNGKVGMRSPKERGDEGSLKSCFPVVCWTSHALSLHSWFAFIFILLFTNYSSYLPEKKDYLPPGLPVQQQHLFWVTYEVAFCNPPSRFPEINASMRGKYWILNLAIFIGPHILLAETHLPFLNQRDSILPPLDPGLVPVARRPHSHCYQRAKVGNPCRLEHSCRGRGNH